jgi:protein required for attachment to host cells
MTTSWILIANASEARLYKSPRAKLFNGDCSLELIAEYGHPESRQKNEDLSADRPGHFQRENLGSATFNEPTEPKKVEAEIFAKSLIEKLNDGRNRHLYDDLIIVASPAFHGILNQNMAKALLQMVSVTIDKDYTAVAEHELLKQLQSHL